VIEITPARLEQYAERHTTPLSELHSLLWKETYKKTTRPAMMVGPLEGALLRLLVRITRARRILEIGMFTGYSALAFAEALPRTGRLITCEVDPKTIEIARRSHIHTHTYHTHTHYTPHTHTLHPTHHIHTYHTDTYPHLT